MINKIYAEEIKNDYLFRGMTKSEITMKWYKKLTIKYSDAVVVVDAIVEEAKKQKTTFSYFNKHQPVLGHKSEPYFTEEMQYGTFPNYTLDELIKEYRYEQ